MHYFALVIITIFLTTSCTSKTSEYKEVNDTDISIYNQAKQEFNQKRYKQAANSFARISTEFPYSVNTKESVILEAYSYYLQGDYDQAINALDNFLYLYPADAQVSYAHYLKALCYYNRISDVYREQETTRKAKAELEILISQFPNSEYTRDARLKMELIDDHLAGKEMEIGRLYLFQNNLLAAIGRFNYVIQNFDKTVHTQEALYRLVEIYTTWGDIAEAKKVGALLGYNYPDSEWYKKAYNLLVKNDSSIEAK
jgi:outer membrane protein assembly factor BamD